MILRRLPGETKDAPRAEDEENTVVAGYSNRPDLARRRAFMESHLLIQTHIEKTGGSSLSAALSGIVGGVNAMDLRLHRRVPLDEFTADDKAALRFLSGHFPFGIHAGFPQTPLYLAAVRDPVERAVSGYRFLQQATGHRAHKRVLGRTFEQSWDDTQARLGPSANDIQCHTLCGTSRGGRVDRALLTRQLETGYLLVIPLPEMTRTLHALRAAFGLPWTRIAPSNVSRADPVELTPELADRIRAANPHDTEMVRHVTENFDERLDRACRMIAEHCLCPLKASSRKETE